MHYLFMQTGVYDVALVQSRITQLLAKYSNGLWMSKLSEVYSQIFSQKLHPQALMDLEKWPNVCMVKHYFNLQCVMLFNIYFASLKSNQVLYSCGICYYVIEKHKML